MASNVGADKPGHALIVAAGNSGSIVDTPTHQSVHVSQGTRMRVPIATQGATQGGVQAWVTMRAGANLSVGLDGPDGEWIAPVAQGHENGVKTRDYNAGVVNMTGTDIPAGSHSALVVWSGKWPSGTYDITFDGSGTADLYVQGIGDAAFPGAVAFTAGVREGTINLPATHPSIIAVGCTINRPVWTSISNQVFHFERPTLDAVGGLPLSGAGGNVASLGDQQPTVSGEVCFFSSAGPTITGVPKPEISAPGGMVVSSMAAQAAPGAPASIFTGCPPAKPGRPADSRCQQIDATHAVAAGTSMSAPMVAGAVALLFQRDPTLTQGVISALLQAGAHPFRQSALFEDQGGPGELDVWGALDALEQMKQGVSLLPSRDTSWMTLSADYFAADASTPLVAVVELRARLDASISGQPGGAPSGLARRADLFDPARLVAYANVDGAFVASPNLIRRAPGVWSMSLELPAGSGGSSLTLGVLFDGVDIVPPKTVPIATDIWTADYPSRLKGGCSLAAGRGLEPLPLGIGRRGAWGWTALVVSVSAGFARGRRRRRARARANDRLR